MEVLTLSKTSSRNPAVKSSVSSLSYYFDAETVRCSAGSPFPHPADWRLIEDLDGLFSKVYTSLCRDSQKQYLSFEIRLCCK